MKNKTLNIDFEIIWKSIHSSLDEREQLLLDEWLAENAKHRVYYLKAKHHLLKEKIELAEADTGALWSQIRESQELPKKNLKRVWIGIAASMVLMVTSYFIVREMIPEDHSEPLLTAENSDTDILPGKKGAILHLGNGKKVMLGSGKISVSDTSMEITDQSVLYKSQGNPADAPSEMHILEVPQGGEFMLVLSDGTRVWVNSESTLKYPSRFDGEKRVVELTGEAYFEVSHKRDQSFEVITGDQTIAVLGTSFNVNFYPEGKEIVSTLIEGKIKINTQGRANTVLMAGQQAVFDTDSQELSTKKVNAENFIAWKNGLFYFENESLDHIMTVLSRWYDIQVVYNNQDRKNLRFTGALKRYDSFEQVIELIEVTDDVKFKIKEKVIIIE